MFKIPVPSNFEQIYYLQDIYAKENLILVCTF